MNGKNNKPTAKKFKDESTTKSNKEKITQELQDLQKHAKLEVKGFDDDVSDSNKTKVTQETQDSQEYREKKQLRKDIFTYFKWFFVGYCGFYLLVVIGILVEKIYLFKIAGDNKVPFDMQFDWLFFPIIYSVPLVFIMTSFGVVFYSFAHKRKK